MADPALMLVIRLHAAIASAAIYPPIAGRSFNDELLAVVVPHGPRAPVRDAFLFASVDSAIDRRLNSRRALNVLVFDSNDKEALDPAQNFFRSGTC